MMDKWSNRYVRGTNGVHVTEHALADRIRNMAIILLTVALLGVGIAGGQAIAFRNNCHTTLLNRMQTECGTAVTHTNTLSRSGGSDTAGQLGRIRANIRAMDVLNETNNAMYGNYFVPLSTFTDMYAIIDNYTHKYKNGVTTIEEQTNLLNSLKSLQTTLADLE